MLLDGVVNESAIVLFFSRNYLAGSEVFIAICTGHVQVNNMGLVCVDIKKKWEKMWSMYSFTTFSADIL